ncbi:hypothetical protein [Massilia genomosp. 1]|uniref:Uncharacterized protein n=1 Tax=Massilia genomosp. 1 TaxID=2609280 RepID=A0ABX0MSF4_9BURK|nr:hypothetical protein [Massilia genomosp. 1]NHZ62928.1 hypothetical protein [Massilia genomosp. 1]
MPAPPVPPLHTVVQFAACLDIGQRRLLLVGGNALAGQPQVYAGRLLPGGAPFDLRALVNTILGALFDLSLPAGFPALPIDTLDATITRAAAPAQSSYRFDASSSVVVGNPFQAVLPIPVQFNGFQIALRSHAGAAGKQLRLSTVVTSSSGALAGLGEVSGSVVLGQGRYALGVSIAHEVSISGLLGSLLDCQIPPALALFLPTFKPLAPGMPLRIYYANADVEGGTPAQPDSYLRGLHVDQCVVEILDQQFSIAMDWRGAADYSFGASVAPLDFGFFKLSGPAVPLLPSPGLGGPQVTVGRSAAGLAISLGATLGFPDLAPLSLTLTAQDQGSAGQVFSGTITYQGTVLGVSNPTLGIAWSKADGFQLGPFPEPSGLDSFIDFAKQLQALSQQPRSGCQALTSFVFKRAITTTFHFNAGLGSGTAALPSTAGVQVYIGGSYDIYILGQLICTIPIGPIPLTIAVPGSLGELGDAIVATLLGSAEALVRGLWNKQDAFFKLLAAQALIKGGQELIDQLICNAGGEAVGKPVVDETAAELVAAAEAGAMDTLLAAATVLAAATAALSFFASIWKCISGEQKRENAAAQRRHDQAVQRIEQLLAINNFAVIYVFDGSQCRAQARWDGLDISDPNATLAATLVDLTGGGGSHDFPVAINADSFTAPMALLPGRSYKLMLCGSYSFNDSPCSGIPVDDDISVDILTPTLTAAYQPAANQVVANWPPTAGFSTPDGTPVSAVLYLLSLWDTVAGQPVAGIAASVPVSGPAPAGGYRASLSLLPAQPPYFQPQAGTRYQLQLQACANHALFDSAGVRGDAFAAGRGIDHTLIGISFDVQ